MKANEIMTSAKRTFSKVGFGLQKKSPEILVAVGIVGAVASAVLACKATTKAGAIVEESKNSLTDIRETKENGITKTALIVVGDFLGENYERSKLYDPAFTTEFRQGTEAGQ